VGLEAALAIVASRHPDVLVIAAAGNSGSTAKCWPAAFPTVVGVASLTAAMQGSAWSNHGDWVRCSTVGEGVVSTYVEGQEDDAVDKNGADTFGPQSWALGTGTSFAAPQITGSLAQLMSANPGLTTNAALQQLLTGAGARPVPGYGIGVEVLPGT
jgi:subtilisin family serine protease